jgi:predicted Ser/Thr protein kinase
MVQCTTCGASERDRVACSHCGTPLNTVAGVIADVETIALPHRTPSPSNSSSTSTPRLTLTATADEGRYIPGTLVAGRYRIIGLLGRGGMGEVYRATDLALAQSVALKILPEEAAANELLLERFHNEVRVARQVSHPNVCRVYDIGEADGLPFISMEYVDGEDLAGLLQRIGRLPSDKALEISRKLCAGLAAAHERGVIHRDLKPQNIMLDKRGQVVIMDFGLAAVANSLRGAEARNGTPAYMSPEQLRGDSVSAKSDIYALGLIIYELFTGRRAYEASSVAELLSLQESSRPVSMTSIAHDVDPAVEKLILRCLQADPAHRPATALSIAAALPGGDPLAAALAAGEIPSPELVAASGKTEGFAPRYAVPCIAFVLLALLAYPFLIRPLSMLAVTPMDYPPAVLEQKARDLAAGFGYQAKPVDWHSSFEWNGPFISYLRGKPEAAKNWAALFAAQPPVLFRYRQSQAYLLSPPDGEITTVRPAPDVPGMVAILLDSKGRLRNFQAIASRLDEALPAEPPQLDTASVFHAAGLDIGQFQEAAPQLAPVLPFDARRAWKGDYPGLPDTKITVEVASWHGKLASFAIRWPWTKNSLGEAPKPIDIAFDIFTTLSIISALLAAIYVAHLNPRKGRGDREGAFRVAVFQFALFIVIFLVNMHIVPRTDMVGFITQNLAFGLAMSSVFWLLYMALEPAVRARWPHSMITWNRLLAGQLGDPRLGSHILVGAVIGTGMRCVFIWREHFIVANGGSPDQANLDQLLGVRWLVNSVTNKFWNAVLVGLAIFFLLSGLRYLMKRDWVVAAVAAILLTLQEGELRNSTHPYLNYPIYLAIYAIFGLALLRMGLVPTIIGIFVVNLMSGIPVSGDFAAWYNPVTFLELAMVAAIAIYGFWRSQSANTNPYFRDSGPPAAKAS